MGQQASMSALTPFGCPWQPVCWWERSLSCCLKALIALHGPDAAAGWTEKHYDRCLHGSAGMCAGLAWAPRNRSCCQCAPCNRVCC